MRTLLRLQALFLVLNVSRVFTHSPATYKQHEAAFNTWLDAYKGPDEDTVQFEHAFQFCLRTVRNADPSEFVEGDAQEVVQQLATAVSSLDESLEESLDYRVGDAQWHVLKLVLDWLREWDKAWQQDDAEDPAPYILMLPVAFQYMSHSEPSTMTQCVDYIVWGQGLLERVTEHKQCVSELRAARYSSAIIYWNILSRGCAMLVSPTVFSPTAHLSVAP